LSNNFIDGGRVQGGALGSEVSFASGDEVFFEDLSCSFTFRGGSFGAETDETSAVVPADDELEPPPHPITSMAKAIVAVVSGVNLVLRLFMARVYGVY
jgi:hypothetical protein